MRDVLERCIRLDEFSGNAYEAMARATDGDLAETFRALAADEFAHVRWWRDLLAAWEEGLVPDIVSDSEELIGLLASIEDELQQTVPSDFSGVDTDTMLDTSAHMEFYLLDSVFGQLLDLTEPGGAEPHRDLYGSHIERLIVALENHYSRGDLARFLGRVLRRAWRDNAQLAMYANRDPLTGLLNRRGLITHLTQWLSWSIRYNRPVSLILIDADDLKVINDRYGHGAGDDSLRAIGAALVSTVRQADLVARYGGDEFAVLAPEADEREADSLLHRIVQAVRSRDLMGPHGEPIKLSVSAGGAVCRGVDEANDLTDRLLAAADRSLYEAKRAGKACAGVVNVLTSSV